MQRIIKEVFSKIRVRLQLRLQEAVAQIKVFVTTANFEDESTESNKTFYLISLMLFISLVFLAPDKIPQTLASTQANSEVLDKIQEIAKKFLSFMS